MKSYNSNAHVRGTPPPKELLERWPAEQIKSVIYSEYERQEPTEKLVPTETGEDLWRLGRDLPAKEGVVPSVLIPGLPRLSFSKETGWTAEYWYYYVNTGLGLNTFPEAKYYAKICLSNNEILKTEKLTDETEYKASWLDMWAPWTHEDELNYLAHCEILLQNPTPSPDAVSELQGLWLEAHPDAYIPWLTRFSDFPEAAARKLLLSGRPLKKEILVPIWTNEMRKGVRLGSPELAEICRQNLAMFGIQIQ